MVSKSQIKLITSLHQKKFRQQHGMFIAEGSKVIHELIQSRFELVSLLATAAQTENFARLNPIEISEADLRKISTLSTPAGSLAVFRMPEQKTIHASGIIVVLDDVRDPGNFGTIIRLCDWFGIDHVVCSLETVDVYNPKVVQATMGSLARVNVVYQDLESFLAAAQLPVYGTFMDGSNIYEQPLTQEGIVIFGNESNGISELAGKFVGQKIAIPRFGKIQKTESLNVATAAAIVLSEFRRR